MKNLYSFLALVLITATTLAQAPEAMSYQAVVRDSGDNLVVNQPIGMQISILQTSTTGIAVYTETQTPTTNVNGLVTLEIGTGTTTDNFTAIDWAAGPYFIKTEIDPAGGASYTITGTSQLMSVPYALYAKTAAEKIYTIGLWPELGGYVFWASADGKHGLVAETKDQEDSLWYSTQNLISTPSKHSLNGQKFRDWRLPTKHELNEMYLMKTQIGGFNYGIGYWSSTEYNSDRMWIQDFSNGSQFSVDKPSAAYVRSVRAF